MKKALFFFTTLMLLCLSVAVNAQDLADYNFSTGTDANQWITLSSSATELLSSSKDDNVSSITNIGFTFPFGDNSYTQFWVSSNGVFSFSSSTSTSGSAGQFTSSYISSVQPKICGVAKDLTTGSDGYVKYELTGTAPNRVLVCEFFTTHQYTSSYSSTVATCKWQVQLYESDSKVVVVYGTTPSSSPSSYQIGLSQSSSDIWTINPSTHEATHATGAVSTTYSVWPGENRYYAFERPVISCPKPTGLAAALTPGNGSIATLSWTKGGEETNWVVEYSTASDFTGATQVTSGFITTDAPSISVNLTSLTAETKYYARVKADCGGGDESEWSNPISFTPTDAYTLPLNEGSSTSSYVPFYYYVGSYTTIASQFIIPAADLASIQWATIDKLTFYNSTATVSYGSANFTVYAGEVNTTTQSGSFTDWNSLTAVYTGTVSVSNNEMVITFDQPFQYTTGNLLIGFKINSTGTSASYSDTWKGVSATTGASVYSSYSSSVSTASFLPQVTINYTPGEAPSCLPPTNLIATASGQNVTLTWESEASSFNVNYANTNDINDGLNMLTLEDGSNNYTSNGNTHSYTIENMPLGDYYFWVWTNCSATEQSMPAGPANVHIGYCEPTLTSTTTTYYISRFTTSGGVTNIDNVTTGTGASYSNFYDTYSATAYPGLTIDFTITIAGGSTYGSAIWVDWNNDMQFSEDERVYQTSGYSSSPHNGSFTVPANTTLGNYRMRIVSDYYNGTPSDPCSGNTGEFEDYKLTITEVPSCLPPTALSLSRNGNQITATWESEATSFNIDINGTVTENVTTPYVFNAELSTTYTVRVQANCGNETSEWTNAQSITTPACWGGHTIEYTLTDAYNDGWNGASITFIDGCEETTLTLSSGSSTSGTINSCADYISFIWNSGNYDDECSFTFTEGGNTLFSGSGDSYSDGAVIYTIGTQTCPKPTDLDYEIPGARNVDLSWTKNGTAEAWQICLNGDMDNLVEVAAADLNNGVYTLGNLEPETDYTVKVRAVCGSSDFSCWSEEIYFTTDIACPAPSNPTVGTPGPNQVELTWTKTGTETAWQLRVNGDMDHLINVTEGDDATVNGTNDNVTYTLNNLEPGTSYTVVVRAYCGGEDGQSEWSSFDIFTTAASCPAPVLESTGITGITGHTANVAWTGFTQNDSYKVYYRVKEHIYGIVETFDGTSIPTEWELKSGLLSNVMAGTATLTTASYGWTFGSGNGAFNNHARTEIYGTSRQHWLISPSTTLTSNAALNFDLALTYWTGTLGAPATTGTDDKFVVLISTDDGSTWNILRQWDNADGSTYVYNNITCSATGENVSIDLSAYDGETIKVAFYGESTTSNADNYLHIDNVTMGTLVPAGSWLTKDVTAPETSTILDNLDPLTPYEVYVTGHCTTGDVTTDPSAIQTFTTTVACPAPVLADVDPTTITTTTATLTWTGSAANAFVVAFKAANEAEFTEVEATGTPFTFADGTLTPGTTYTVKVRANCGNDGTSEWSNVKTFTTECVAIAAQGWSENFDDDATGSLPNCWEPINEGTSYQSYPIVYGYSSNSSPNTLYFYTYGNSSSATISDQYAILPEMTGLAGMRITMQVKGYSTSSSFKVGTMSDNTDASTFTEIENADNPAVSTSYQQFTFDVPTTATEHYVAIMMPKPTSTSYATYGIYIDDISIEVAPTCYKPTAATVDNESITTSGATISWTPDTRNADGGSYSILDADDNEVINNITIDQNNHTATLTGLTENTPYTFKVATNCANTAEHVDALTVNFTTLANCQAVTNLEYSDLTATGVTLSWTDPNGDGNTYIIKNGDNVLDGTTTPAVTVNGTTAAITGLTGSTNYTFTVVAHCSTADATGVDITVRTLQEPVTTYPYSNGFETTDDQGWEVVSGTTNSWVIGTGTYNSGDQSLYVSKDGTSYAYNNSGIQMTYVYRTFQMEAGGVYNIEFDWKTSSGDNDYDYMRAWLTPASAVFTANQLPDGTTNSNNYASSTSPEGWTDLGGGRMQNHSSWTSASKEIIIENAGQYNIVFMWAQDNTYGSGTPAAIDNLVVTHKTCFEVSNLQANNETTDGATLTWEANSHNSDNVTYTVFNVTNNEVYATSVTGTSINVTGLNDGTSYEFTVTTNCGTNDNAEAVTVNFTTLEACPKPTNLTLSTGSETPNGATITWTAGSTDNERFTVEYRVVGDEDWIEIQTQNYIEETNYTINTLDPETSYQVRVSAVCGTELSGYSNVVEFTTLEACPAPAAVTASNVTANAATISWNGTSDSYTVSYRTAENMNVLWSEGFEDESTFTNWTRSNTSNVSRSTSAKYSDNYGVQFTYTYNPPLYLISPDVSAYTTESGLKLEFYYSNNSNNYTETFYVGFSSTNTEYESFDFGTTEYSITNQEWKRYFEDIPTGTKYIAIKYTGNNTYNMYVDDFVIGTTIPASDWQTVNTTETSTTLTDLTPETTYEAKVQGHCANDDSGESELISFTPSCSFYQLLTDASDLAAGDKIIIAAATYDKAMSTTQNTSNHYRGITDIIKNGNRLGTPSSTVQILTLEEGTTTGTWAFNTGNGYLKATSSSSNYLDTQDDITDNASWTITVGESIASIVANGTYTNNTMRYNNSSTRISCYSPTNSQYDLAIYKLTDYRGKGPDTTHTGVVATMGDSYECMGQTFTASGDYEVLVGTSTNGCDSIRMLHLTLMEQVKTPTFSPAEGEYNLAQNVEISCETADATIYYTTDGTVPTAASAVYSQAITVEAGTTVTIKAIAMKEGMGNSEVATATYTVTNQEHTITFNAGTGTCTTESMTAVSIDDLPTATLSETCTQQGWAFYGWSESSVANETIEAPVLVSTPYAPTNDITLYAVYSKGESQETEFNFETIATANNWTNGIQYSSVTIDPVTLTATGGGNDGKYYSSDNTWRIYSSSNGTVTITSAYGTVTAVSSDPSKEFTINNNGVASYTASANTFFKSITVTTGSSIYYSNPVCLETVATPTFNLAEGSYSGAQSVEISCATEDATIYYTLDGTEPSTSSTLYGGAIAITETATLKAIAVKENMNNSAVAIASYTIVPIYTVTLDAGNGSLNITGNTKEGNSLNPIDLSNVTATPSDPCVAQGWTFAGWSTVAIQEPTTEPTLVSNPFVPTQTTTLYAVYSKTEEGGGSSTTESTINFSEGSYNNDVITWELSNVVSIVQEKYTGQTAPSSSYVSAPRWYSGNMITITPNVNISSLTVTATSSSYASALNSSTYTNATASSSGSVVTITPTNGESPVTIVMNGQSRISSLAVTYTSTGSSTITYTSNPACINSYVITAEANDATYGTVTGTVGENAFVSGAEYVENTVIVLQATASEGYHFVNWTKDNAEVSTNAYFSFTVTEAAAYVANFAVNSYNVTLNTNNGTINSGDIDTYTYGVGATLPSDVTLTGNTFGGWYDNAGFNGDPVTAISTTETGDKEFWAKWTANSYNVTLNTNNGTINSGNVTSYTYGVGATLPTDVTLTGNTFGGWYDNAGFNGDPVTTISTTETGDKGFWAKWTINSYTIAATANPIAGGSVNGAGTFNHGATATLTATAATGYTFVNWTEGGQEVSTNATYEFNVTGARTLVANFSLNSYAVSATANPSAAGTITGAGTYSHGAEVTVSTTVNTGFSFVNWTENGNVVSTSTSFTFTFTGARTLVANFDTLSYNIAASANPNAGGTVEGAGTYKHFKTATLTATAATGYTFVNWTEGGQEVSTNATYEFTVTGARELVANFELNSYEITATSNPTTGGTVTGAGTYNHFASATLTATPANGYHFVNWTESGNVVSTNTSYEFEVNGARDLVANFAITPAGLAWSADNFTGYTMIDFNNWKPTVNNQNNVTLRYGCVEGNLSSQGGVEVNATTGMIGDEMDLGHIVGVPGTYRIYAVHDTDPAYYYDSVVYTLNVERGVIVALLKNIDEAGTAVFADYTTESTLTHSYSTDGLIAIVAHDQTVRVQAEPVTGYHFSSWQAGNNVDGYTPVSTDAIYTYTVPNIMTVAIKAVFDTNTYALNVVSANETMGIAEGSTTAKHFLSYQISATPNTGYHFTQWSDGNTQNPRTVTLTENTTYTAEFAINSYNLTINYKYADGTQAAATHTESVNYNAPYSVTSPVLTGYTADQLVVTGTMGTQDVELTVTYSVNNYTLTILYQYTDGTTAAPTYTGQVNYNEIYSVSSPEITGYTASQMNVSGTMPADDVTVDVTYYTDVYTLTVHYVYADNTPAAEDEVRNLAYNVPYTVTSPTIEGYTPDQVEVSGTMGEADVEVTVVYSINSHNLTVNYVNEASAQVAESHTATLNYHDNYSVVSPQVAGYAANKSVVSGTMGDADKTETVTYYLVETSIVDATNCAGTGTGSLTVTAPLGNFEYSLDGVTFQTETQFANLNAGDYTLYIRPTGEDYNYSGVWTVNSNITMPVAVASANAFYCPGDNVNLSGDGSTAGSEYTYAWSGPNNFTANDINAVIATAEDVHSGTYTLAVTNTVTNCVSEATVDVIVNTPNMNGYLFTIATHGDAYANLVNGEATPVFADPTVQHYLANAGCNVTLSNDAETYHHAGDYTITWTAEDACGNTATTTQVLHVVLGTCPVATDYDGNTYPVVALNNLCWMAANLRTTHYSDSRPVPNLMVYSSDMYPDATANLDMFGYLYDWTAAMDAANGLNQDADGNVHGICPAGWRMPKESEIRALVNDGARDIFDLRTTDQWLNNFGTNTTGFSLLPAGCYNANNDRFENLHGDAYIWGVGTSTPTESRVFWADCKCYNWQIFGTSPLMGFSVRCVKEN